MHDVQRAPLLSLSLLPLGPWRQVIGHTPPGGVRLRVPYPHESPSTCPVAFSRFRFPAGRAVTVRPHTPGMYFPCATPPSPWAHINSSVSPIPFLRARRELYPFTTTMLPTCATAFVFAALVVPALGASYTLSDTYMGSGFLSGFTHQAIADPTHGRVYVPSASSPVTVYSGQSVTNPFSTHLRAPICRFTATTFRSPPP